jgi:hypothetical protein
MSVDGVTTTVRIHDHDFPENLLHDVHPISIHGAPVALRPFDVALGDKSALRRIRVVATDQASKESRVHGAHARIEVITRPEGSVGRVEHHALARMEAGAWASLSNAYEPRFGRPKVWYDLEPVESLLFHSSVAPWLNDALDPRHRELTVFNVDLLEGLRTINSLKIGRTPRGRLIDWDDVTALDVQLTAEDSAYQKRFGVEALLQVTWLDRSSDETSSNSFMIKQDPFGEVLAIRTLATEDPGSEAMDGMYWADLKAAGFNRVRTELAAASALARQFEKPSFVAPLAHSTRTAAPARRESATTAVDVTSPVLDSDPPLTLHGAVQSMPDVAGPGML